MPWQRPGRTLFMQASTENDVRTPFRDGRQENGQFRRSITVIAIEENDDIRILRISKSRQTSAPISSSRLLDDVRSHPSSDLRCLVTRVAVNNDGLCDQIGREI